MYHLDVSVNNLAVINIKLAHQEFQDHLKYIHLCFFENLPK